MSRSLTLALLCIFSLSTYSSDVIVTEVYEEDLFPVQFSGSVTPKSNGFGEVLEKAGKLVAFGEKFYSLVKHGKPTITQSVSPVSVIPVSYDRSEAMTPLALSNWKSPMQRKYSFKVKNNFGRTSVDLSWRVLMTPGGQTEGGKGAFITGALIKPMDITVKYGYDVNMTYSLISVSNAGTEEDPIAQAVIDMDIQISTMFQTTVINKTYLLSGDGSITQL